MIQIGHVFQTSGAVALLTAPADNDSLIVLCKEGTPLHVRPEALPRPQYITGRVYVAQLPSPRNWDNGTYDTSLEDAVRHFADRAGIEFPDDPERRVRMLVSLARNVEARLQERPSA